MVTPPPSTDPGIVFPICPGSGGGGEEHHSKIPRVSKNPKLQKNPSFGFLETRGICSKSKKAQNSSSFQFRIFGNSRNLLKIQRSPKFLEFPKIQKSKNPNPSFGFLETRGICSKSKKTQNSSSFQNSKNPKIPTPVSDFWKLEEFAQNPKKPKIPRVSKNPKIQKSQPSFGFLETRGILGFFGF